MYLIPWLVMLVLSCSVVQFCAASFINNNTVPSDILDNLFFDEIQNNPNLLNLNFSNTRIYDSEKCILALRDIIQTLPSIKVLPFIDSWGKFPSGILYGNLRDLGNFDQCIRTSVTLSDVVGQVHGQYCVASVPILGDTFDAKSPIMGQMTQLSIGICVPDICDPSFLTLVFQSAMENFLNGTLANTQVNRCQTAVKPDYDSVTILGIVIFSIFAGLMALSTTYDVYTNYFKKSPIPILLAFSVITNGRKLFAINTTKSTNNIDCLVGIRVFSMAWVMYCHNFTSLQSMPLTNNIDIVSWSRSPRSSYIIEGTVSVDSFLFLSGLLLAWIAFRELDKSKGKLNILVMYVHRYMRLTPPVAAVTLFSVSLVKYLGSGPLWTTGYGDYCEKWWWTSLLYIQNYVNPNETCIGQTWYLSVDTQLYILSPLILIPLWRWGRKFVPVMVLMSFLSIGCIIATYYAEDYVTFMGLAGVDQQRLTYQPTHTRYSVWLVGVGFGYFLHKNRKKTIRPPKYIQLIGWIVCFGAIFAMLWSPHFRYKIGNITIFDQKVGVWEAALFEALRRPGWGIGLAWIVFACHFGFGGIVNTFLSHPFWQPLGRLTFSLYLVHMFIQEITFRSLRTKVFFSDYMMILNFWSIFGLSLMAAIIVSLAFEAPVLVIEKALLGSPKKTPRLTPAFGAKFDIG